MRNVTQASFLLVKHLKSIGVDLSCTVSAINLRMDELISDEKCDASIVFARKTS